MSVLILLCCVDYPPHSLLLFPICSVIGSKSSFNMSGMIYKSTSSVAKDKRVDVPFAIQGLGENFDCILLDSSKSDAARQAQDLWPPMSASGYLAQQQVQLGKVMKERRQSLKKKDSGSGAALVSENSSPTLSGRKQPKSPPHSDSKAARPKGEMSPSSRSTHKRSESDFGVSSAGGSPAISPKTMHRSGTDSSVSSLMDSDGQFEAKQAARQSRRADSLNSNSGSNNSSSTSGSRRKSGPTTSAASKTYSNVDQHLLVTQLFAVIPDRLLFSCGHYDNSFRVTAVDTGKLIQSVIKHSDIVTCVAWTHDFGRQWLVTGSRDCTLMVWEVSIADRESPVAANPLHVLYGHSDAISTVATNAELDVVLSGSADGTIIVHSLREGIYTRSILVNGMGQPLVTTGLLKSNSGSSLSSAGCVGPSLSSSSASVSASANSNAGLHKHITWIGVSVEGLIVIYCGDDNLLCTYTINGRMLACKDLGNDGETLSSLVISEDGNVLITGGSNCLVVFRWVRTLQLADNGPRKGMVVVVDGASNVYQLPPFGSPIRSLYLTRRERHLIVGLESGELRILAQDPEYLRHRLQQHLIDVGIL